MAEYKYKVLVDDNFHYMDESERYTLGEFDTCAAAVAACKEVVDDFLIHNLGQCDDVFASYLMFGDDPFIVSDDPDCRFHAREYARQQASRLESRRK